MLITGQTSDEFELFNTNMNSGSSHACNCRGSSQTVAYYVKQECDNVEQCPKRDYKIYVCWPSNNSVMFLPKDQDTSAVKNVS